MTTTATITITQTGIVSASSPGRSRSDGLANGAQVSVTSNTSVTMRFLWVPDEDTTAVSTQTPNSSTPGTGWTFTPTAGVYGSYLMEFSDGTRRIFAIRTPNAGLRIPALNETALTASLISSSAGFVSNSDFNENSGSGPFSHGNYGGWYSAVRETIKAVDLTRGLISDNIFATVSGTAFRGPVSSSGGFTGSLQYINPNVTYLAGGTGIGITTQSNGQVIVRQNDYRTPQDFGALADDSHNDLPALQACSDFCIANQIPMYLPAGRYRTSGTWLVGKTDNVATIHISGVPGLPSHGLGSTIHCDAQGLPAIICQGLWWSVIENIGILGPNTSLVAIPSSSLNAYISTGLSSSQWAPQCGLAIDVYNTETPMGQGYPGITYNTGSASSHNNTFVNLRIENCVAAVWNAGGIGLASSMRFQQLYALDCAFGFCTSQTQARANEITNFAASFIHTMYDGRTFGAQNGSCPTINGAQEFTTTYRLLNVVTSFDPLRMEDVYAESLLTIGTVLGQHPAVFSECYFGMGDYDDTIIHGYMGAATTTFNGCFFHTREPVLNFLTLTTPSFLHFNACHFTSRNDEQDYYYVQHKPYDGVSSVTLHNCNVSTKDVTGYKYFNTEVDSMGIGQKVDVNMHSKRVRTFGQGFIIGDGELRILPSTRGRAEKFAASGYSWSGGTLRFTAGTANEFMVDDIIYWYPLTSASGGSPNLDLSIPPAPDGDALAAFPAVKITAVNGLSVTGSSIGLHTELSKSYAPSEIYIAQRDWAPAVYVTASWTTSSPTITFSPNASQMVFLPGDFIKADFGLAPNTRVVSQSAQVLTINKNPIQTRTNEPIYFAKFVTSPTVTLEGTTSIVSGTYQFLHSLSASGGLTGSLQRLPSGETYLAAGTNVTIVTQSNGQVLISASESGGGGAPSDARYLVSEASSGLSNELIVFTAPGLLSAVIPQESGDLFAIGIDNNIVATVSGTTFTGGVTIVDDAGLTLNGDTFAGGTIQQGGGTTGQFTWRGNVRLTGDAGGTYGGAALFITRENTGELVQPLVDIYTGSVLNTPAVRITNSGTLLLTRRNANSNPWEVDNGGGTRSQFGVSGSSTTPTNTVTPAGWISMTVSGTTAWMPYYL